MANKAGKCPLRRFFPEFLTLQWINLLTVNCTQKYLHWTRSCERKPSVDQGSCMMQHSQGDYGRLLIIQIHRFLNVICCNHHAFVTMWNNSSFLPTEMWEMLGDNLLSSIILQEQKPEIPKMIPRFNTPAREIFLVYIRIVVLGEWGLEVMLPEAQKFTCWVMWWAALRDTEAPRTLRPTLEESLRSTRASSLWLEPLCAGLELQEAAINLLLSHQNISKFSIFIK